MNWFDIIKQVTPLVLANTKLKPLVPYVNAGIEEAEAIKGATSAEKLAHATSIAMNGVAAVNAQAGKQVIDPNVVASAISNGISKVVDATNLIHKS